jgi:hypothetical protein
MGKKFTYEEVKSYFEEQGCELLSDTYVGNNVKLKYKCSFGHVSETEYRWFLQGKRCKTCSSKRKFDEIQSYFRENGCKLLSDKYLGHNFKLKYRCLCGEVAEITYGDFRKGHRCMKCGREKLKYTYEEVKSYFEEQGCELLSDTYIGSTTKLKYRCICGNVSEIEYRNFRQGGRCKECSRKRANETNRKNHGGELYFQTDGFKTHRDLVCMEKYGVKSPLQNPTIKLQQEKTNLERYGVKYVSQSSEIRQKTRKTLIKKYGYEYVMQNPVFREKFKATLMERYGVPSLAYLSKCCSKESQTLFWEIQTALSSSAQTKSHFAEFNTEFVVRYNNEFFKYDFVNSALKKCIEYNGSKFHPTPDLSDEETNWCVFHPNKTVKEAREYELRKQDALLKRGYSFLVVWDTEFHKDRTALVKKCIDFLTKADD